MKRYKSLFETIKSTNLKEDELIALSEVSCLDGQDGLLLFEVVINIEPDKEEIKNILINNKQKIINYYDINDFEHILNKLFESRKFIFKCISSESNKIILLAGFNEKTDDIRIFVNLNLIEKMKNDESIFNSFIEYTLNLLGHELIHREEFLKIKYDKTRELIFKTKAQKSKDYLNNQDNINKMRKYLADKYETMSYAWQIINTFRLNGLKDSSILKILKNYDHESYVKLKLGGKILEDYHYVFNKSEYSSNLKLLYKYMYQYLE